MIAPASASWDGTIEEVIPAGDTYTITNEKQLAWIASQVNSDTNNFSSKIVLLEQNLDLSGGHSWTPIGKTTGQSPQITINAFNGTFDGNGKTISNLYINTQTDDYQGLFGYTNESAIIKNLGLINVNVSGHDIVGDLVGINGGTIENCYVTGTVSGNDGVGGLVGGNTGTITNCYVTGSVSGHDIVGGLVGLNVVGTITNCYATGSVSGHDYVGGLVGGNRGTIEKSIALNQHVRGTTNVSRVVGFDNGGTLTNNSAWAGLKDKDGSTNSWSDKRMDKEDGADVTSENLWDKGVGEGIWNSLEFSNTNWQKNSNNENFKLLVLQGSTDSVSNALYLKPFTPTPDPTPQPTPQPINSGGSSTDTGSGNYKIYERSVTDGGYVSFGTSPIVIGVNLPEGSNGQVILTLDSEKDWLKDESSEYLFDISVHELGDGTAEIKFKLSADKLAKLGLSPADICLYHSVNGQWVKLETEYEIGVDGYVYYTAYTDSFSPFKIVVEKGSAVGAVKEMVTPVETKETEAVPTYVEPTAPVQTAKPEQTASPMGVIGLIAGLGVALAVLRRK